MTVFLGPPLISTSLFLIILSTIEVFPEINSMVIKIRDVIPNHLRMRALQ